MRILVVSTDYPSESNKHILHPVVYVSSYVGDSSFLCLSPYITFGLCEMMWQTPRIPRHGSISPPIVLSPEGVIEVMRDYLGRRVIVPQPLRDRLIPAPIGYYSYIRKRNHSTSY
jgi:hypothetical protein